MKKMIDDLASKIRFRELPNSCRGPETRDTKMDFFQGIIGSVSIINTCFPTIQIDELARTITEKKPRTTDQSAELLIDMISIYAMNSLRLAFYGDHCTRLLRILSSGVVRVMPARVLATLLDGIPDVEPYADLRSVLTTWASRAGSHLSAMNQQFHPPASFPIRNLSIEFAKIDDRISRRRIDTSNLHEIDRLFATARYASGLQMIKSVCDLRHELLRLVGAVCVATGEPIIPTKFVKTSAKGAKGAKGVRAASRATCRAVLQSQNSIGGPTIDLRVQDVRKRLGFPGHAFNLVSDLVAFVAKFCGRVETWIEGYASATCAPIDKVGLALQYLTTPSGQAEIVRMPHFIAFMSMAISEFSARKAFTIESQQHGGLNEYLRVMLTLVKTCEPSAMRHIARLLPVPEVMSCLSRAEIQEMRREHFDAMQCLVPIFDRMWPKGFDKSLKQGAIVLRKRSGSSFNSTGWNNVAGAWNCLAKTGRACDAALQFDLDNNSIDHDGAAGAGADAASSVIAYDPESGCSIEFPHFLPIFRVVAADQARWAVATHSKTAAFQKLMLGNRVLPWRLIADTPDIEMIGRLRSLTDSDFEIPKSWTDAPVLRKCQFKAHADMVCGIAVSPDLVATCKELGFFGSKPWGKAEQIDDDGDGGDGGDDDDSGSDSDFSDSGHQWDNRASRDDQ